LRWIFYPLKIACLQRVNINLKNVVQTSKSWLKTRQTWKLLIAKKLVFVFHVVLAIFKLHVQQNIWMSFIFILRCKYSWETEIRWHFWLLVKAFINTELFLLFDPFLNFFLSFFLTQKLTTDIFTSQRLMAPRRWSNWLL
jgi:hypothetical protein